MVILQVQVMAQAAQALLLPPEDQLFLAKDALMAITKVISLSATGVCRRARLTQAVVSLLLLKPVPLPNIVIRQSR